MYRIISGMLTAGMKPLMLKNDHKGPKKYERIRGKKRAATVKSINIISIHRRRIPRAFCSLSEK